MKIVYILLTIVFIFVSFGLIILNIVFSIDEDTEVITRTPVVAHIEAFKEIKLKGEELSILKDSPFNSKRGVVEEDDIEDGKDVKKVENSNFELTGIVNFNKVQGATIIYMPKGPKSKKTDEVRGFYYIGDVVANDYILEEIKSKMVVLMKDEEKLEIAFNFGDSESLGRLKENITIKQEAKVVKGENKSKGAKRKKLNSRAKQSKMIKSNNTGKSMIESKKKIRKNSTGGNNTVVFNNNEEVATEDVAVATATEAVEATATEEVEATATEEVVKTDGNMREDLVELTKLKRYLLFKSREGKPSPVSED